MKLRDFALPTDENLDPAVVQWLNDAGFNVMDVCGSGLQGVSDISLLQRAFTDQRIVVTHDADFGALARLQGEPVVGLVYLRPGHIDPAFTIGTLAAIIAADPEVIPPFILAARRHGTTVSIRIRNVVR